MNSSLVESYEKNLDRDLSDPIFAAGYLNECFKEGKEVFLLGLRDVARAYGVAKLAEKSGLNRESLYKIFRRNPRIDTLQAVLEALGLKISIEVGEKKSQRKTA